MKRKKSLTLCIILCAALFTVACANGGINDPETGEIHLTNKLDQYIDGVYLAYGDYYNEAGLLPAMELTVKGSVITRVRFDYFDQKGQAYSTREKPEELEEVQVFRAERKSMNSALLQTQSASSLRGMFTSPFADDYVSLAARLVKNAEEGNAQPVRVIFSRSYKAAAPANEYGYTPQLTVDFTGKYITSIQFLQLNEEDRDIIALEDYIEPFTQKTGVAYRDLVKKLCTIPNDKTTLKKEPEVEGAEELYDLYNKMAEDILKMHLPFELDPQSLFSSNSVSSSHSSSSAAYRSMRA